MLLRITQSQLLIHKKVSPSRETDEWINPPPDCKTDLNDSGNFRSLWMWDFIDFTASSAQGGKPHAEGAAKKSSWRFLQCVFIVILWKREAANAASTVYSVTSELFNVTVKPLSVFWSVRMMDSLEIFCHSLKKNNNKKKIHRCCKIFSQHDLVQRVHLPITRGELEWPCAQIIAERMSTWAEVPVRTIYFPASRINVFFPHKAAFLLIVTQPAA